MLETNKTELDKLFETMRICDYRRFNKDVRHYCGVTRATISLWRRGKTTPSISAKRIINSLSKRYGYEPVFDLPVEPEEQEVLTY